MAQSCQPDASLAFSQRTLLERERVGQPTEPEAEREAEAEVQERVEAEAAEAADWMLLNDAEREEEDEPSSERSGV